MSGFRRIIREIHRRSLWQILGIYLAASWLVLQVVDVLTDNFGLPGWVPPFALVLLLIGLPIVLATAFVQEGAGPSTVAAPSPTAGRPAAGRPGVTAHDEEWSPHPAGAVAASTSAEARSGDPGPRRGLLTWRNALLGGVGAFAFLGVVAAGYMAMRTLGIGPAGTLVAKGILEERERILVAEFSSASGDSSLATAVAQALRIDLSQSPAVVLVEQERVAAVLERMGRPPGAPLDLALAREVAERDGIKAVVGGQVDAAGSGYVLTASLVATEDSEVLASAREAAEDEDAVIGAIDALSARLRERIGESLRSIRNSPSLERVTTPSLEALRYYSQAEHASLMRGEEDRAIALLERAVTLDTAFAMAWRKLGVVLGNRGEQRSRSLRAFERAVAHADRLPERERFMTEGSYYQVGTGEHEKAVIAYQSLLEIHPDVVAAVHNLALAYDWLRNPERAAELYERALALDTTALTFSNYAMTLANLGRWEEAEALHAGFMERFPAHPRGTLRDGLLAAARGDWERARARFEGLRHEQAESPFWRTRALYGLAAVDATRGKLSDGLDRLDRVRAAEEARGLEVGALRAAVHAAALRIRVAGIRDAGVRALDEALETYALAEMDPLDRPYLEIAAAYAAAGRTGKARELLGDFERDVPSLIQHGFSPDDHHQVRGEIALAEGRFPEAAEAFRRADTGFCMVCALPGLAAALEGAGDRRAAIQTYERYLETDYWWRLGSLGFPVMWPAGDWLHLARTYERLGGLYDEEGDLENAAKYYAMFLELWAEADEELQPRVRAARARLEEIVRERG